MKTLAAIAAGLVAGSVLSLGAVAHAEQHHTQKVDLPSWTVRQCHGKYDVNCRHDHAKHVTIVRELPGSTHMVCVFYAERSQSRKDYCS